MNDFDEPLKRDEDAGKRERIDNLTVKSIMGNVKYYNYRLEARRQEDNYGW